MRKKIVFSPRRMNPGGTFEIVITTIRTTVAVRYEDTLLNANRLTRNTSVPISLTRGSSLCRIDVPG